MYILIDHRRRQRYARRERFGMGACIYTTTRLLHVHDNEGPRVYSVERGHERKSEDNRVDDFHGSRQGRRVEQ